MGGRWLGCYKCGEKIYLETRREDDLRRSGALWFCLWGHSQHFPETPVETEANTLRLERDRLKQERASYEDRLKSERESRERAERRVFAARGQITRLKTRAANGVCPCCNRTFANLHRHMAAKHAGFVAEEVSPEGAKIQ